MGSPFEKTNLGSCITEYILPSEYENVFKQLIKNMPDELWEKAAIGAGQRLVPSARQCDILFLTAGAQNNSILKTLDTYVLNVFKKVMNSYQEENHVLITADEGFQILKYHEGGFYKVHVDGGENFLYRKVSGILYINDDYDGGELEFTKFNLKIKPKKNSILLFPSNYAYEHIAHTVTKGEKICIVSWFFSR
jgi:predicted 2-oxoglutarate/Fe(II)-dependent dioxygenase YbiX